MSKTTFSELKQGDYFDSTHTPQYRYIKTKRTAALQMIVNAVCIEDGSYAGFEEYDEVVEVSLPFLVHKIRSEHSFDFGEIKE